MLQQRSLQTPLVVSFETGLGGEGFFRTFRLARIFWLTFLYAESLHDLPSEKSLA